MSITNLAAVSEEQEVDVKKIIDKIQEKAAGKTYIYRGESECYCKVSSSLYRGCADLNRKDFLENMKEIQGVLKAFQERILKKAETYLRDNARDEILPNFHYDRDKTGQDDILAALQHYSGATNLIDFTEDYTVALFFACNKSPHKNGRVILVENPTEEDFSGRVVGQGKSYEIVKSPKTLLRAEAQKSVFIQSETGVLEIDSDKIVCIPKSLKMPMLKHLGDNHGISTQKIYDDWAGVIERVNIYMSAVRELTKGQEYDQRGDNEKALEHYNAADHYGQVANPGSRWFELYINRARTHVKKDDYDKAAEDYAKAASIARDECKDDPARGERAVNRKVIAVYEKKIESDRCDANAYLNFGKFYATIGNFNDALEYWRRAIELHPDNVSYYREVIACIALIGWQESDLDNAIANLNTDIAPDSDALTYCVLGMLQLCQGQYKGAKLNLGKARDKGADFKVLDPKEVAKYESQDGAQWPNDIKKMLTRDPANSSD